MTETFDRRREFVNSEFARLTRGKSLSQGQRTKILRALWSKAKREIR